MPALFALLAAGTLHGVSAAIKDMLCQNAAHWEGTTPFTRVPDAPYYCEEIIDEYLGDFENHQSFTQEECDKTVMSDGTSLSKALTFLAFDCCGGHAIRFPCGVPYHPNMCASDADFNAMGEFQMEGRTEMHCSGDELIQDKDSCVNGAGGAGYEKAWDGNAGSEKCDVGRIPCPGTTKEDCLEIHEAACKGTGGKWGPYTCMDMMQSYNELDMGDHSCDAVVNWPIQGHTKKNAMDWVAKFCCHSNVNHECEGDDHSPGEGEYSCQDVKTAYKDSDCCNHPDGKFHLGKLMHDKRRLKNSDRASSVGEGPKAAFAKAKSLDIMARIVV